MSQFRTDLWACLYAVVVGLLVISTGIALLEFGVVDNTPWVIRTIVALEVLTVGMVFIWRRRRRSPTD